MTLSNIFSMIMLALLDSLNPATIVIINLMYPKKFDKVKEERELQIELMKNVY